MGVSYTLRATDFTVNNAWAAAGQGSSAERQMKQSLKRGSYGQLDLYFLSDLGGGLLGFCYFPLASPTSTDRTLDGCINLAASLPGAEATNYDMGLTAVHEVGHWFGLYHVFQGQSCSGSGDGVSDTPIQRIATEGCPTSQDSCPNSAGADNVSISTAKWRRAWSTRPPPWTPQTLLETWLTYLRFQIHNYMDYSYDACMYEFTSGQNSRATSLYQRYRAGK